jgi:hypothetical protein
MQISGVSLALTWSHRLCLLRVLLCWERWHCTCFLRPACLFTAPWEVSLPPSPVEFSSHCCFYKLSRLWLLGGAAAPASRHVCLQLTWVFPPLLWSFPPPTTLTSFPDPVCWAHACLPLEPLQPAWLVYLQFREGFLSPIFSAQCAPPSFPSVFIVLIAYYSVSLFSPGGGRSVQGAMLIWPRLVCESTMVLLSSPCPRLPKPSGHGWLAAQGPSWFLR